MKLTPEQIAECRSKFKILHSTCTHCEKTIREVIEGFVRGHEEMFITIRTKTEDSFIAKITRDDKDYADPFKDVTDIIGIRIIVQYKDDAESIESILKANLIIDKANSRDTRDLASVSSFGYSAIHLVASLPKDIIEKRNLYSVADNKFEIQIRTNLEHAWASKSRELSYNKEIQKKYNRDLNRLSALLEIADAEFVTLKKKISRTPRVVKTTNKGAQTTLTGQDIINILESSEQVKSIVKALADHGIKVQDCARIDYAGHILDILTRNGIKTNEQATAYLEQNTTKIISASQLYLNEWGNTSFLKDSLLVAALAIIDNAGMTPEGYSEGWNTDAKTHFRKAAKRYLESEDNA